MGGWQLRELRSQICRGGVFTETVDGKLVSISRGSDIPTEVLVGDYDIGFCGSDVFNEGALGGQFDPLGFRAIASAGCELVLAAQPGLDRKKPLRVASKYPLSAIYFCQLAGIELEKVAQRGGKLEAKAASGAFDAIVDICETGQTLRDNGLEVVTSLGDVSLGIVYRKEEYDPQNYYFEPWKQLAEMQTIQNRKNRLDSGEVPEADKKNTMSLLADRNRRDKALGEEAVELAVADALGDKDDIVEEFADLDYTAKLVAVANDISPLRCFNAAMSRNKAPTLWLPEK